jgi:hypothetical protein
LILWNCEPETSTKPIRLESTATRFESGRSLHAARLMESVWLAAASEDELLKKDPRQSTAESDPTCVVLISAWATDTTTRAAVQSRSLHGCTEWLLAYQSLALGRAMRERMNAGANGEGDL